MPVLQDALAKIKSGVLSNDLSMIADGFFDLTGEKLDLNDVADSDSGESPSTTTEEYLASSKKDSVLKDKSSSPVSAKENTFIDEGTDHKDSNNVTPEISLTKRGRPPTRYKEAVCHVCGKKDSVNESLSFGDFYRCNNCTG
ncbi:hypothetical protein CL653_02340 [bacterium]|nr:hypothetical protein [bacterium]